MEFKEVDIRELINKGKVNELIKYFKLEEYFNKGVKKVKKEIDYKKIPFWDVKVVKVKGKEKDPMLSILNNLKDNYKWEDNGKELVLTISKNKPITKQENFVNGENLDKIKFPCFCSFVFPRGYKRRFGMINKIGGVFNQYILTDINEQSHQSGCLLWSFHILDELIKYFDIHILKGKVVLFEKEEGK